MLPFYLYFFYNINMIFAPLHIVSAYSFLQSGLTTEKIVKSIKDRFESNKKLFLEKLELNEYIDDYIFHMVLPYGKAYDNAKTLMNIKREDFVPWMNGILDHNVIWNRTIGEMRKKFFTGYDLNQTVIQVLTNDGITHKLPLIWKMSCDFIKHECFTCDFKPTCGGSYMGCLWDDNFIRNNKK